MSAGDRVREQSVFHCETCRIESVMAFRDGDKFWCSKCQEWRHASTVAQLGAIYAELVGYDPFEGDPSTDPDGVRATIDEILRAARVDFAEEIEDIKREARDAAKRA